MLVQMVKLMVRNEKGQGMVEYGLILALVAVVAIAGFQLVGTGLSTQLGTVNGSL